MAEAAARQQKTEMLAKLYDGKLRLERRNGGPGIYARTYLQGKNIVKSTGEHTLPAATKVATDWYLELRDRIRKGEHLHGRSFADMAEAFIAHAEPAARGLGRPAPELPREMDAAEAAFRGREGHRRRHEIPAGPARDALEGEDARTAQPVKPATLKKDMDFVRLVLRHAKYIEKVPRRPAGIPVVPRRGVGGGPEPAAVPRSRPVGEGAQAGQGADLRSRTSTRARSGSGRSFTGSC